MASSSSSSPTCSLQMLREDVSGILCKNPKMLLQRRRLWLGVIMVMAVLEAASFSVKGMPRRILWDTDDLFGLLYLLKLNRSEFELEVIEISDF